MDSTTMPSWIIITAIMFVCSSLSFSWIATIVAMLRYERTSARAILGILIPPYALLWCALHARQMGLVVYLWLWIVGIALGLPVAWLLWTDFGLAQLF